MPIQKPRAAPRPERPPRSVHEFVRLQFRHQQVTPLPPDETRAQTIERIAADRWVHEIDQELFDWFLEGLPPKAMGRGWFAFAEGAEPLRLFVIDKDRFLTRQLTWEDTDAFCRLANIAVPT